MFKQSNIKNHICLEELALSVQRFCHNTFPEIFECGTVSTIPIISLSEGINYVRTILGNTAKIGYLQII